MFHHNRTLFRFQLCTYGVDLCYQLDGALRSPLTRALREARDKLIDSIKLRSIDDKWIPMNLHSKSAVTRCLQEHSNMGLELSSYITGKRVFFQKKLCNKSIIAGDTWIQLTASTLSFTKMFLTLLEDCMRLKTTELIYTIDETLYSVFEAQIRHTENSLRNELNQDVSIYKVIQS